MRLVFGIVLGAILTMGAAYYHDSSYAPFSGDPRPIVNWDVAGRLAANATAGLRREVNRLLNH